MPGTSMLIDVDEHPIAWREAGTGDVVLFLHGLGHSRIAWDRQLEDLSDRWRCVAWDLPGFGASEPLEDMTFPAIANAAIALLDRLGADSAHLVGLSFGGQHALHVALDHPERVRSLVLADTSPVFGLDGTTREEWIDQRLEPLRAGLTPADIAESVMVGVSGPGFSGPDFDLAVAAMERLTPGAYEDAVRCLPDHDVRDALATIGVPTLVVVGELDPSTPPNVARLLAAGIPNASFVEMPGIGHLTPNEAPQEFNRLVREFLEAQEPTTEGTGS
ncbi:MAG: alpha/beta fold hydrolase [Actinomycetota bacterium]|nr:alpha/beta fold hydrolase [Actinomycetota bacterium]MEC9449864.1 alpha/beta fold hydrolase [Actinomycetota bacterium]MED5167050.1 alpha/beta fold hydrolase [Actinomycetota bacterium]MED5439123.1 alpha/beta fold hydrolase [Actinomycetota bacterium]